MYAAITTRYLGPTDSRSSRIVASAGDGRRLTVQWNSGLNSEQNHRAGALALRNKMGWDGDLVGGWHDDTGLWVFADGPFRTEAPTAPTAPTCTVGICTAPADTSKRCQAHRLANNGD